MYLLSLHDFIWKNSVLVESKKQLIAYVLVKEIIHIRFMVSIVSLVAAEKNRINIGKNKNVTQKCITLISILTTFPRKAFKMIKTL